jgi:hypothetical protein
MPCMRSQPLASTAKLRNSVRKLERLVLNILKLIIALRVADRLRGSNKVSREPERIPFHMPSIARAYEKSRTTIRTFHSDATASSSVTAASLRTTLPSHSPTAILFS